MNRVELHEEAELELFEAASYLNAERPGLGDALVDSIEAQWMLLLEYSKMGRRVGRTLRKRPVPRFPYTIVYRLVEDGIFVVAIAHDSRRPGYWRDRLR